MSFEVVSLTENKYQEWDNFCLESNDAWFLHTTDWMDCILNYKPELETQDFSFLIYEGKKIKAIVPLTLERYKTNGANHCEFSFGGWFIPAPALDNSLLEIERSVIYKLIFNEIDQLAHQKKVTRAKFLQSPLALNLINKKYPYQCAADFRCSDISLSTQLVDLSKDEGELWKNLRRNHRRSILKGSNLKIHFYNSENINREIFQSYKDMHHKAAGRKTRPDKTFELAYEWITKGFGFLVAVDLEKRNIGFEYYLIYKNNVCGASSANDPDLKNFPIRHFLEWQSILWMKSKGFDFYEIGLQPFSNPDKKKLDIAHFKKGFGGEIFPLLTMEKNYITSN